MALFRCQNSPPGASPSPRGFTLIELILIVAVIGIMSAFAIPYFVSFIRVSETQGAAREVTSLLNQARQLAISRNASYSVEVQANPQNRVRFCPSPTAPCTDANAWTGPGTDGTGWMRPANLVRITPASATGLTFTSLGAATTPGTVRVQNSQGTSCLDVVVSASGRIRTQAAGACP